MSGPLAGRVAVVTGAAGAIGRALALEFAAQGAAVGALDRVDPAEVVEEVRAAGGRAMALRADTTDDVAVAAARDALAGRFGPADIVVNNAGWAHAADLDSLDIATWEAVLAANVTGSLVVTRCFAPTMREAGFGRIVMMASMSAELANGRQIAYGSAKAAVIGLTRSLAFELGPFGVTVNAVCPGAVDTPAARAILTAEGRRVREERVPVGRLATPEDVAHAAAFLAAPRSSYVNGQILYVDGGLHAAGIG